jgi:hypothetical protein
MNKLSILLLICLLSEGNVNGATAEPSDVSFGRGDRSNYILDISYDVTNSTPLSKIPQTSSLTSETAAFPPTFWIVGLCLVFLGYKIKTKPTRHYDKHSARHSLNGRLQRLNSRSPGTCNRPSS